MNDSSQTLDWSRPGDWGSRHLTVFRAADVACPDLAFIDRVSHYHTPLDNLKSLNLGSVQHQWTPSWPRPRH